MTDSDKTEFAQSVRLLMEEWVRRQDTDPGPIGAHCLMWSSLSVSLLNKQGLDAQIQAGSAYWPRLRPEQDDGKATTYTQFGYEFTPGPEATRKVVVEGCMPEMHVWATVAPDTIVDLTTGFQPARCKILTGLDWPGDPPPAYIWSPLREIGRGTSYRPHRQAIALCYSMICALTEAV